MDDVTIRRISAVTRVLNNCKSEWAKDYWALVRHRLLKKNNLEEESKYERSYAYPINIRRRTDR